MRNSHGSFIWYELMTTDIDAAQAFYGDVVGWRVQGSEQPGMDYRIFNAGETSVGGLMALPSGAADGGMRPGWYGYIGVDDVDQSIEEIVAAGGKIHMPATDTPGVGRLAMLADPQGVGFYVMRGAVDAISTAFEPATAGHGCWNELVTGDQAAALAFYTDQFGWTRGDAMPMGDMGDYQFIEHDGRMIGAVMNRPADGPPPMWHYYFRVADIDTAAAACATDRGARITFGPAEVPGGDFAVNAVDPQGALFGLVGARTEEE